MYIPEERILDILRWTLDELNKGVFRTITIEDESFTSLILDLSEYHKQSVGGLCTIWHVLARDYDLISFPEAQEMFEWCSQYLPEESIGKLYWFEPMTTNSDTSAMIGFTKRHEFISSLIEKLETSLVNNN